MKSISHLLDGSNRHQKKAIQFDSDAKGPLLVLAGAGSGKTQVLTKRLAYLILKDYQPSQLLALTFTEASATEMRERATALLRTYIDNWNETLHTYTFHSLAYRLIRSGCRSGPQWSRLGYQSEPHVPTEEEIQNVYRDLLPTFEKTFSLSQIQDLCHHMRFRGEKGHSLHAEQNKLYQAFYYELLRRGYIRFDDMVPMVVYLFTHFDDILKECQDCFHHIMVDEFQDTSPDQLEFLRLIALPQNNLFLVGDDYQAIYGFRGANKQGIKKLWKLYPEITLMKLQVNYRSTKKILNYANTIFTRDNHDMRKKLVPGRESKRRVFVHKHPVYLNVHATPVHEINYIKSEMLRLVQREGVHWNEFAILYRTHYVGDYYKAALKKMLPAPEYAQIVFNTIHGAKGLEYPVVFLVGVEQGLLPFGTDDEIKDRAHYDEERRLYYVAITRAEAVLYIHACKKRWEKGAYHPTRKSLFLFRTGNLWQRSKLYWQWLMQS